MRKICAMVLCIAILMSLCAVPVAGDRQEPLAVLFAASDFQFPNESYMGITYPDHYQAGAAVLHYILGGVRKTHSTVDEVLFLGDYEPSNYSSSSRGLEAMQTVMSQVWGLGADRVLCLQGNHDHYDMPGLDGVRMVFNEHFNYGSKKGSGYIVTLEREGYHICMIHHDAFPETRPTDSPEIRARKKEAVTETAQALEQYLTKTLAGSYKPVIIMGHLPLHYSRQDNIYARELVDALNRGAADGRNIFYLFGHNHSGGYDHYLGGSCVYHTPGTQIPVPDGSAADRGEDRYDKVSFDFTYFNAGYVGFASTTEPGATLSGTVLEIYEDRVELSRYNGRGMANLKNEGCANTSGKGKELRSLPGVVTGPEKVMLNRLAVSLEKGPAGALEVGASQKISLDITGAAGYPLIRWQSSDPQILSVEGTGREAKITGLSGGTAELRAEVTDSNGFRQTLTVTAAVRPREAVQTGAGQWLWCPTRGSLVAGATVTDAFVTRELSGQWTNQPLSLEMLTGCDPNTPGVYRCTVTYEGAVLRNDFLLTVWPGEAVSPVETVSLRQLYLPAQRLMAGQTYAFLGTVGSGQTYAMGIRAFGGTHRTVATGVELLGSYAALPGREWSWTARSTKTGASNVNLQSNALQGYLTLGREDFLTLNSNSFRSELWTMTSQGISTGSRSLRCSAGAFYTGPGAGNVVAYQAQPGQELITYAYTTALQGSITARNFREELRPGGELVISGRLSSNGSELFTHRIPITASMLSGITLENLMTPGTYACGICYGDRVVVEGYTLVVV